MKERPILFSAPMVRALLDGSKTQTRRLVKPAPVDGQGMVNARYCGHPHLWLRDGPCSQADPAKEWRCPYGQPGDRLWVRETWNSSGFNWRKPIRDMRKFLGPVHYSADPEHGGWMPYWGPMKPSIHMPRWASRITLEITSVRVERLHDISEADALAEGIQEVIDAGVDHDGYPRDAYRSLWEQINGDGSWEENPWVWVIEFKRIDQATP